MIALLLILLFVIPARADILFLDFNNSPKEVQAAREAAAARGEKLIVIPEVGSDMQSAYNAARKANNEAARSRTRLCGDAVGATSDACDQANHAYQAAHKSYIDVVKTMPMLTSKNFSSELGKINQAKPNISAVIMSGHDGNREFGGLFADLNEADIENAFIKNKPLADNVRSLYLWGCYTATTDDFINGWKRAFPPTAMMAGFSGQGPLNTAQASGGLLKDLLVKEPSFQQTHDKAEIQRLFDSLEGVNGKTGNVNAAICTERETIVSKKGVRTIAEDIESCMQNTPDEKKNIDLYTCFLNADEGCEDTPRDSMGETTMLRKVYDYFQETNHCDDEFAKRGLRRPVTTLAARRLLFDHNVRANFEKVNKAELAAFNRLLDELGVPPALRIKNLGQLSRKDYLDLLKNLRRDWILRMNQLKDGYGRVHDVKTVAYGIYLGEIQKLEKGSCVPLSWVEEGESLRASPCGMKENMQGAVEEAQDEVDAIADLAPATPSVRGAPKHQ